MPFYDTTQSKAIYTFYEDGNYCIDGNVIALFSTISCGNWFLREADDNMIYINPGGLYDISTNGETPSDNVPELTTWEVIRKEDNYLEFKAINRYPNTLNAFTYGTQVVKLIRM
jgi:hypothetical protein